MRSIGAAVLGAVLVAAGALVVRSPRLPDDVLFEARASALPADSAIIKATATAVKRRAPDAETPLVGTTGVEETVVGRVFSVMIAAAMQV